MVANMKCILVIFCVVWLSGCAGLGGATYSTTDIPSDFSSKIPLGDRRILMYGEVPLAMVLSELRMREVVRSVPVGPWPEGTVKRADQLTISEAVLEIERRAGWIYDPATKSFYAAGSTHPIDAPDSFGRPTAEDPASRVSRPECCIRVRFAHVSAGMSALAIGGSGAFQEFSISLPDGVQKSWQSSSERSFINGVSNVSATGTTVQTSRQAVSAGIILTGMASRLPGGLARCTLDLEVSTFTGNGVDKASLKVPVEFDGPRSRWVKVASYIGADAAAQIVFHHLGVSLSATGETGEVWIRVD